MSSTIDIRNRISDEQKRLISAIWAHCLPIGEWIPVRALHKDFGGKATARALIDELGGSIVHIVSYYDLERYRLTTLGVLLSDYGERYERLLAEYLSFVRQKCYEEPSRVTVSSQEVAEALHLKSDEVNELGRLLGNESKAPFTDGGTFAVGQWTARVSTTIEDVPSDTLTYVQQLLGGDYDPQIPVEALNRYSYLRSKGNKELLEDSSSSLARLEGAQPAGVEREEIRAKDPRAVFVVHGRNEAIRAAFFDFLRSIGLKPLEWSDVVRRTGKSTPYIGEILDTAFSEAQAIVVLMTPDDEARLRLPLRNEHDESHEIKLTPQARPNVLFEAGMAMGRSPDRTVLVQIGKVRPFSDIAGRHVIRLDNSTEKRQELAHRLEVAGCLVDLNGTDWHRKGDLKVDLPPAADEEPLENQWGKSGNLWWLYGDLTAAWNWIDRGSKYQIVEGLKRCHHHADQLGMTDRNIVARLYQMMTDADGYSDPDWTRSIRDQFLRRVESVRNDAGQVAQSKQPGFIADPK